MDALWPAPPFAPSPTSTPSPPPQRDRRRRHDHLPRLGTHPHGSRASAVHLQTRLTTYPADRTPLSPAGTSHAVRPNHRPTTEPGRLPLPRSTSSSTLATSGTSPTPSTPEPSKARRPPKTFPSARLALAHDCSASRVRRAGRGRLCYRFAWPVEDNSTLPEPSSKSVHPSSQKQFAMRQAVYQRKGSTVISDANISGVRVTFVHNSPPKRRFGQTLPPCRCREKLSTNTSDRK